MYPQRGPGSWLGGPGRQTTIPLAVALAVMIVLTATATVDGR